MDDWILSHWVMLILGFLVFLLLLVAALDLCSGFVAHLVVMWLFLVVGACISLLTTCIDHSFLLVSVVSFRKCPCKEERCLHRFPQASLLSFLLAGVGLGVLPV